MGQRDVRRLLIIGAMTVVSWAVRRGAPPGSWLARMLARKPRMLVAVALANRMAAHRLGADDEERCLQGAGAGRLRGRPADNAGRNVSRSEDG